MKLFSGLMMLMFISLWGCSGANDNAVILDASGKHPVGWVVAANGGSHPAAHLSAPGKCAECHGGDLKGGISKVSCFSASRNGMTCHAQGPSGHPAGWALGSAHGAHAKAAAVGSDGLAFCKNCHGADFRGGTAGISCFSCHTASPHAPWLGATTSIHSTTDVTNASACGGCHSNNARLNTPIAPPANAGCFNNTLCHDTKASHAYPFQGSLHSSAAGVAPWSACLGCHSNTPGGTYPVAAGTAPNCTGCHINGLRVPVGTSSCWDCHGSSATNGRPNGATFPDRNGEHGTHDAIMANCDFCHFGGGSGTATHGNSNRVARTVRDVIINKNPARYIPADNIVFTQNAGTGAVTCNGDCHIGVKTQTHNNENW